MMMNDEGNASEDEDDEDEEDEEEDEESYDSYKLISFRGRNRNSQKQFCKVRIQSNEQFYYT